MLRTDVRQLVLLPVSPNVFHRVQLRCVGRQELRCDVPFGELDEFSHQAATVRRQPVPDDQQRAVDVAEQSFQEVDDLKLADGTGIEPEVEAAQCQPG